ncbi:MAG: polyprenol monophosphomannose synthase [Nitrospira sp.]|nr:polyprenol monophosphomannose synthase [Nitrospira sp.]MDH4368316.1 polyprenol monophosphomannose synthase [Nitrospira sp.]MDH5496271.1 polyprenol monophosphomannose synthase [Nitrospira sp.]MDH5726908.1 polyprenol monophosphomannose synthase [Nitrospira sp.]
MPISQPLPPSLEEVQTPSLRYFHFPTDNQTLPLKELQTDEAYLVPNFELAEELIARGVDSARIAIGECSTPDVSPPGYSQVALGRPLIPASPFTFDQSIVIVLPTYNERSNLEALVATIGTYLTADILIVDDNSPDGTGQLADRLRGEHGHIHVLHRPNKQGLGPAYLAGFEWALHRNYDRIIEMDCDFSHAPWDIPRLVHGSRTADLVIGSRYVAGGGTENWNARRRLVSRCGNTYVRLFLGSMIHDWTGGFRCYHRELLLKMHLETVRAKGYVFQVELAWRAVQLGAGIRELPIRFSDRVQGQSKLGWQSFIEGLLEVPQMCFQRY